MVYMACDMKKYRDIHNLDVWCVGHEKRFVVMGDETCDVVNTWFHIPQADIPSTIKSFGNARYV